MALLLAPRATQHDAVVLNECFFSRAHDKGYCLAIYNSFTLEWSSYVEPRVLVLVLCFVHAIKIARSIAAGDLPSRMSRFARLDSELLSKM